MRSIKSAVAKNNFGELIELAGTAPMTVTKYDRPVVVVMGTEEFDRLKARDNPALVARKRKANR